MSDDEIHVETFIQEGGIPVPDGADFAVGSWSCPCGGFSYGPFTSESTYVTVWVECPYCHRAAEIQPIPPEVTR